MHAGRGEVTEFAEDVAELHLEIGEVRTERDPPLELAHRFASKPCVMVGLRKIGVHVRELAADERVEPLRRAGRSHFDVVVNLARLLVFPAIVVGDGKVERRFRVVRIHFEGALEVPLGDEKIPALVRDDTKHVVHVRVAILLLENLTKQLFGLLEFARRVVLAAKGEELFDPLVHASILVFLLTSPATGVCAGAGRELCRSLVVTDERSQPTTDSSSEERPLGLEETSPPEIPPPTPPDPTPRGGDRGRIIAFAILGSCVALGALLIAIAPGAPSAPAAAVVAPAAAPDEPKAHVPQARHPADDAGPTFTPTWRIGLEDIPGTEVVRGKLGKLTLANALAQAGIAKVEIRRILLAVRGVRRIERSRSGDAFVVARGGATGAVSAFEYVTSPTDVWQARADESAGLTLKKLDLFVERKHSQAAVVIAEDLAKAIGAAGLPEQVIGEIDEAFDGRSETAPIKPGVRLRVVGSEQWVEGVLATYRVDAVEYLPRRGGSPLRVYYYERESSGSHRNVPSPGFYDAKGHQPFRGLFRSPVPLARITSRFNPKRMHPVLHVVMPHNGIDFGAASGTAVFAASSGTVHTVGDSGPCGNMVQIEHAGGLSTSYCHLSRFAAGLHPGQHVETRQLVGYVGKTGRVTGPHLHFAAKRGGTFIDPMALKMDGVRTLPPTDREAFAKRRNELDAALDAIALPAHEGADPPDDKDEKEEEWRHE